MKSYLAAGHAMFLTHKSLNYYSFTITEQVNHLFHTLHYIILKTTNIKTKHVDIILKLRS